MGSASRKKAGVMGWPVSHSLSPRLHGYWIKKYGIDASYEALPIEPQRLGAAVMRLAEEGFVGVNLTIPHKEAVIPYLTEVDDIARGIGAVNTVVIAGPNKRIGFNTDTYGFIQNIKEHAEFTSKHKAVVLGAGGAARGVCFALAQEGFSHIVLLNRTLEKARHIADVLGANIEVQPWENRAQMLAGADALVNTTSLGMSGKDPLDIDLSWLPTQAIVNDIVYTPLMTPLLIAAKRRGNPIVDGLGMLMHQAVPAFEAWFGIKPEVDTALKQLLLADR